MHRPRPPPTRLHDHFLLEDRARARTPRVALTYLHLPLHACRVGTDSIHRGTPVMIDDEARPTRPSGSGISRRNLVAGTAWAVPAVVVATAAPAFAASPASCSYTFASIGATCHYTGPGNHYYRVGLRVNRDLSCSAAPVSLTITATSTPSSATDTVTVTFPQGSSQVYVGDSRPFPLPVHRERRDHHHGDLHDQRRAPIPARDSSRPGCQSVLLTRRRHTGSGGVCALHPDPPASEAAAFLGWCRGLRTGAEVRALPLAGCGRR